MEKSGETLGKKYGKKAVFTTQMLISFSVLERLEMMTANKVMSGFKTHTEIH